MKREDVLLNPDFYKKSSIDFNPEIFNDFYDYFTDIFTIVSSKINQAEKPEDKHILYDESEKGVLLKLADSRKEWLVLREDLRLRLYDKVASHYDLKVSKSEFIELIDKLEQEDIKTYEEDADGYLNMVALEFGHIIDDLMKLENNDQITDELCAKLIFDKLGTKGQVTRQKYFFFMEVKDCYPFLFKKELLDEAFNKSDLYKNIINKGFGYKDDFEIIL